MQPPIGRLTNFLPLRPRSRVSAVGTRSRSPLLLIYTAPPLFSTSFSRMELGGGAILLAELEFTTVCHRRRRRSGSNLNLTGPRGQLVNWGSSDHFRDDAGAIRKERFSPAYRRHEFSVFVTFALEMAPEARIRREGGGVGRIANYTAANKQVGVSGMTCAVAIPPRYCREARSSLARGPSDRCRRVFSYRVPATEIDNKLHNG